MSLPTDPDPTDPAGVRSRSVLTWGLNAVGIAAVAFWFVRNGLLLHHPAWVWALGAVALAAWAVREGARTPRVLVAAAGVMTAAGSCVVVPTDSLLVVPVIVGLVVLGADLRCRSGRPRSPRSPPSWWSPSPRRSSRRRCSSSSA